MEEIGVLDVTSGSALNKLAETLPHIRLEIFTAQDLDSGEKPTAQRSFPIAINLYGYESYADTVGSILSEAKIFLQEPNITDPTLTYRNPHVLSWSSLLATPRFGVESSVDDIDFEEELDAIIHNSDGSTSLYSWKQDSRIRTRLRRLSFLIFHLVGWF
jgi:hypothetical protein